MLELLMQVSVRIGPRTAIPNRPDRNPKMTKKNPPVHYLTEDGVKKLEDELVHLRKVRQPEVASRLHEAVDSGEGTDSADFEESKNEQAFVEGRIQDIENILATSRVVHHDPKSRKVVEIGSTVTVANHHGKRHIYQIVGSAEAAPLENKISNESPLGHALVGGKKGAEVEYETPSGHQKLTIKKIQ
jgi:transcription elongation factor GreA